jgi:hypothetical protein
VPYCCADFAPFRSVSAWNTSLESAGTVVVVDDAAKAQLDVVVVVADAGSELRLAAYPTPEKVPTSTAVATMSKGIGRPRTRAWSLGIAGLRFLSGWSGESCER